MINKETFIKTIQDAIKDKPSEWRDGQTVFNFIDYEYGVSREVQFNDHIDCFYNDERINDFIEAAWKRYSSTNVHDFPGDNMIEE